MDSNTLNSRFKEVSEQIKKAVADDPALSAMIGVLLVMFESQSALNNSLSEQNKSQSEQIKSQSEQIKSQHRTFKFYVDTQAMKSGLLKPKFLSK